MSPRIFQEKIKMIKKPAIIENLQHFLQHALQFAEESGVDKADMLRIELAIEEAIVNIVNYSFPEKRGDIELNCECRNNTITFRIIDNGTEFNPLNQEDPDLTLPIEEREVGGLGIFLIKNTMDDVSYQRKDNKNILTLRKKLPEQ